MNIVPQMKLFEESEFENLGDLEDYNSSYPFWMPERLFMGANKI